MLRQIARVISCFVMISVPIGGALAAENPYESPGVVNQPTIKIPSAGCQAALTITAADEMKPWLTQLAADLREHDTKVAHFWLRPKDSKDPADRRKLIVLEVPQGSRDAERQSKDAEQRLSDYVFELTAQGKAQVEVSTQNSPLAAEGGIVDFGMTCLGAIACVALVAPSAIAVGASGMLPADFHPWQFYGASALFSPSILVARALIAGALNNALEYTFPRLQEYSAEYVIIPELWATLAAADGVTNARKSTGRRVRQDFAKDTIKDLMAGPQGSTVVVIERDVHFLDRIFISIKLTDLAEELDVVVEKDGAAFY